LTIVRPMCLQLINPALAATLEARSNLVSIHAPSLSLTLVQWQQHLD